MPPTIASGSGRAHHSNCVFSRNISSELGRKPPLLRPCTGKVSNANTRETGTRRVSALRGWDDGLTEAIGHAFPVGFSGRLRGTHTGVLLLAMPEGCVLNIPSCSIPIVLRFVQSLPSFV